MNNAAKNFDILVTSLNVLHNYFDSSNYFSDLYPSKILDLSVLRSFRVRLKSKLFEKMKKIKQLF